MFSKGIDDPSPSLTPPLLVRNHKLQRRGEKRSMNRHMHSKRYRDIFKILDYYLVWSWSIRSRRYMCRCLGRKTWTDYYQTSPGQGQNSMGEGRAIEPSRTLNCTWQPSNYIRVYMCYLLEFSILHAMCLIVIVLELWKHLMSLIGKFFIDSMTRE